jgi:hypothetical protein
MQTKEDVMHYLLLIYADEQVIASKTPEEQAAILNAWFAYTADAQASGKMLGGEALTPTTTATTVRVTNGQTLIADGPFAETKEQLGGYYVIDADDLDEAIAWAAKMPHLAAGGSVEVRPIMVFNAPPPSASDDAATVSARL